MDRVQWRTIKAQPCERVGKVVALQAQVVLPSDILPDQHGRIVAHRCELGMECNHFERPSCMWAGTLPGHDPFR